LRYIFTWPVGAALCVGMLVSAIGKTLGLTRTAWRGRVYTEGQASAVTQAATPQRGSDTARTGDAAAAEAEAGRMSSPAGKATGTARPGEPAAPGQEVRP